MLVLILLSFILKGSFLVGLFPTLQGPDEQAHYAAIQLCNEPKEKTWKTEHPETIHVFDKINTFNYSRELIETANIVGFDRIKSRKRNTTPFIDSYDGKNEEVIKMNNWERYVDKYPPSAATSTIYHKISSIFEGSLSSSNILVRFFSIRLFSVFIGAAVVLLAFLISKDVGFSDKSSLLIAAIISFQPMFSMASAIVNYDILLIFFFSLFIYGAVSLLKDGLRWKNILIVASAAFLGYLTKGTGVVLIVAAFSLFAWLLYKKLKISWKKYLSFLVIVTSSIALLLFLLAPGFVNSITGLHSDSKFSSQTESLREYFEKTIGIDKFTETESSYWGNFGWLDTKIHGGIINVIIIIEILAVVGIILFLILKNKTSPLIETRYVIFFILMALGLQLAIRFFDWRIFDRHGEILIGTPGRYFLPNIVPHFILIAIGLYALLKRKNLDNILKTILVLMIILFLYSTFNLIIPRYYL